MLCAQFILRKRDSDPEEVLPLPCRSWGCSYCAPNRRRQLMAEAAAGEPNKLLTLTVNVATGEGPAHRRDLLHDAWKKLVKRINRQFAIAPERRWTLTGQARTPEREAQVRRITSKTEAKKCESIPYFAFLERTKRGEPHLHILLRTPFIPQDWLSEQMRDLMGSPIVWIEAIKGAKHAVAYVTKYITKAPAQWGNKKRYWRSRNWKVNTGDPDDTFERVKDVEVIRVSWNDYSQRRVRERYTFEYQEDGWYKIWRPGLHPRWNEANSDLLRSWANQEMPPPHPA